MKRGRNQRRRQGVNPNRALDSNGPEVRIRGTAQQIYDKYLALARDATSSGDRVKAENYLQHAEHYFRVLRAMQPPQPAPQDQSGEADFDGDQPSIGDDGRDQQGPGRAESGESPDQGADRDNHGQNAMNGGGGGGFDGGRRRRRRPRRPGSPDLGEDAGDEEETADEAATS